MEIDVLWGMGSGWLCSDEGSGRGERAGGPYRRNVLSDWI